MMRYLLVTAITLLAALSTTNAHAQAVPAQTLDQLQQAMVKVYGAGGMSGLEAYQSGFLIGKEGLIVTADTLVLEQGEATIVLNNGLRYSGRVLGADPLLRIAVVKIDPAGEALVGLNLNNAIQPTPGQPLLVLSNLFNIATGNEPASVMRTHLAAVAQREIAFGTSVARASDSVLIIDSVTSNPGAAGGLLADYHGAPVGMIGIEQRGRVTGGWLNYALPMSQVAATARQIIDGERLLGGGREEQPVEINTLTAWGFVLVESITARTPPYVEFVRPGSPADTAGMQPDDLLVMVDGLVSGATVEATRLLTLRSGEEMAITLERDGELIEATLPAVKKEGDRD